MLDKRGVEVQKGQTVIFSMRTGGFGAHELKEATVVKITPRMVRISYKYGNDVVEGNYYPNTLIVVDVPIGVQHASPVVDPKKALIKQFMSDFKSLLRAYDAKLGVDSNDKAIVLFDKGRGEFPI